MENYTHFKYICDCGNVAYLRVLADAVQCSQCRTNTPLTEEGIIEFTSERSIQTQYFNSIYSEGARNISQLSKEGTIENFLDHKHLADLYAKFAGLDIENGLNDLDILESACGSGWITANYFLNEKVKNSRFHAFDISPFGVRMLANFVANKKTKNVLELSIQNASSMKFSQETFDFIIGSSILHHFNNYEGYLGDIFSILKYGGIAVFGEPFAIGYGLAAAAMKIAEKEIGEKFEQIETFYNDLSFRIKNGDKPEALESLVDKHLFFEEKLMTLATQLGFSSMQVKSGNALRFYGNYFIDVLLDEMQVRNSEIRKRSKENYNVFYELFAAETSYGSTLDAFRYLVFTK